MHDAVSVGTPVYFNRTRVEGIGELAGVFPLKTFASPYRSTLPLLDMLWRAPDRLRCIVQACGVAPTAMHLEYCVEGVPGGNPSQTDLMAIGTGRALAIESKWTEPRYERVANRVLRRTKERKDDSSAAAIVADRAVQDRAVTAWLRLLDRHVKEPLTLSAAMPLVYQVIHRAASACAAAECPSLLYLHFQMHNGPRGAAIKQYRADLSALFAALGRPVSLTFYVIEQPIVALESFRSIAGLPKGRTDTAQIVKQALVQGPLFEFGEATVEAIK